MARDIVILAGAIGRSRIGGKAWAYMQYLIGLQQIGCDVYYLEDCGAESWVYDWTAQAMITDLRYPSAYVRGCLEPIGLANRWIYRAGNRSEGLAVSDFKEVCAQASLLIIRANPIPQWRAEYDLPKRRAYIDVDPGFTQISLENGANPELTDTVSRCERLFTIGRHIGEKTCAVPTAGRTWRKISPPVALSRWTRSFNQECENFTCIMDWKGFYEISHDGVLYGQKDREFPKFLALPRHTSQPIVLAQIGGDKKALAEHGWKVVDGWIPSDTPDSYRAFIRASRAEFSIAKHGYVLSQGGWFSDRSVCYLASGKPVLVQDTGLKGYLPVGKGLLTFKNQKEALDGIDEINCDYEGHCRSARTLAEEYFATDRVCSGLLQQAGD